jgi:hypothetical protein
MDDTRIFEGADPFSLSGPVGRDAGNDRADVIKVQTLLANAGYLDLPAPGVPTGWPGNDLYAGIARLQKDNGLEPDGVLLPLPAGGTGPNGEGETMQHLKDAIGPRVGGHAAPTPAQVDAFWTGRQNRPGAGDMGHQPFITTAQDRIADGRPQGVILQDTVADRPPPLPQPKPVRPFPPRTDGGDYHDELAQPPAAKTGLFRNNTQWADYRAALNRLPNLGRNEEYTLMQSFGFEGGLRKDGGKSSTAYGGILQKTLDNAKAAGVPGLEHVQQPDQLGFDQQAAIARWHLDAGLKNVGGRDALETLPDRHAAAALGDTIFRHGEGGAKSLLLEAVNDVREKQGLPDIANPGRLIGRTLFDSYRSMAADPQSRNALLDALDTKRTVWPGSGPGDKDRYDYFSFRRFRP